MDNLLDELVSAARICESACDTIDREPYKTVTNRLLDAAEEIGRAWCGSFLGYHSRVYKKELAPKQPGDYFDAEWGRLPHTLLLRGEWVEYTVEYIQDQVYERAGNPDVIILDELKSVNDRAFKQSKTNVLPILEVLIEEFDSDFLRNKKKEIQDLKGHFSSEEVFTSHIAGKQMATREKEAADGGILSPPHLAISCMVHSVRSYAWQNEKLSESIGSVIKYLQTKHSMKGEAMAKTTGKVFIGHGGSKDWLMLKDFIRERLHLEYDEFNRESVAGVATKERLEQMLDSAVFGFIVMTGEDKHSDNTVHARENVVHEIGLFQGRLGFGRAIVVLEKGCEEFSNIVGLGQIRFPKGDIKAAFEDIRMVLEREKII